MTANNEMERKIGELQGILSSVPNQMAQMWERLENASHDRIAGDAELQNQIKVLQLTLNMVNKDLDSLKDDFKELSKSLDRSKCLVHESTLNEITMKVNTLQSSLDALARIFESDGEEPVSLVTKLKHIARIMRIDHNGESFMINEMNKRLNDLEEDVSEYSESRKSALGVAKTIAVHIAKIVGAIVVAYILIWLGLK